MVAPTQQRKATAERVAKTGSRNPQEVAMPSIAESDAARQALLDSAAKSAPTMVEAIDLMVRREVKDPSDQAAVMSMLLD